MISHVFVGEHLENRAYTVNKQYPTSAGHDSTSSFFGMWTA